MNGGGFLWGWDATNEVWRKVLVNSEGKLIIDPSEIFENPPTDGETAKAPQSDWAYDHWKDPTAHHTAAILQSLLTTQGDIIQRGAAVAERLGIGADGKALVSNGTDLAYEYFLGRWGTQPKKWEWLIYFGHFTETVTGSGSTIRNYTKLRTDTGTTPNSTARAVGYNHGYAPFATENIEIYCSFIHRQLSANGQTWFKYDIDASGDPTDKAFGFRVDPGYALKGIVHDGASLHVVDLNTTLTSGTGVDLFMRFVAGDKIYWYVNGVEKGSSSAIPTEVRSELMYTVLNSENASDDDLVRVDVKAMGWYKGM